MAAQGFAGKILEYPPRPRHLADALRQGLAFLPRQQAPERLTALENEVTDAIQEIRTHLGRAFRPRGKRLAGSRDGGIHLGGRSIGETRDDVARIRRVFTGVLGPRRHTLAVDVMRETGNTHGWG